MAVEKFADNEVDLKKLIAFGFSQQADNYVYQVPIMSGQFQLLIKTDQSGILTTKVIDSLTKAEYVLHLQDGAEGKFVAQVRHAYQSVLTEIQEKCYRKNSFHNTQAKEIITYVNDHYGNQLEFLWKKFPHNAIWRRTDTNKWYGALLTVKKSKLGFDSDEEVTVLDMRGEPMEITSLIDNKNYFPGYHMNKRNWFTIILDDSVANTEIVRRMDNSYNLAK